LRLVVLKVEPQSLPQEIQAMQLVQALDISWEAASVSLTDLDLVG
jgi:hypothetical protein